LLGIFCFVMGFQQGLEDASILGGWGKSQLHSGNSAKPGLCPGGSCERVMSGNKKKENNQST
jgi:hypothetical protein